LVESAAGKDVAQSRLVGVGPGSWVLRYIAQGPQQVHQAGFRVVLAGEDAEQAGFAGAVSSHQADLFARGHGEAGVGEDPARGDVDGEISNLEHEWRCYLPPSPAFGQAS